MEQLTIDHLSIYLPYGLKGLCELNGKCDLVSIDPKYNLLGIESDTGFIGDSNTLSFKPILRPMICLMVNGLDYLNLKSVEEIKDKHFEIYSQSIPHWGNFIEEIMKDYSKVPYWALKILVKHHYDIFGLIEKGLATPINHPINFK